MLFTYININTEPLSVTSKEVSLDTNAEKINIICVSLTEHRINSHHKDREYWNGNVAIIRYFGTKILHQIRKHGRSKLNKGNACYHSVPNILYFRWLLKKYEH
jgi:hypothetical protein